MVAKLHRSCVAVIPFELKPWEAQKGLRCGSCENNWKEGRLNSIKREDLIGLFQMQNFGLSETIEKA